MRKTSGISIFMAAAIFAGHAFAEPVEIGQAGRKFSQDTVTVSTGEEIVFVNDDKVPHNIYTKIGGQKVDKGLSRPGEKVSLSFDDAGDYSVSCAIHPKMKLAVTVN